MIRIVILILALVGTLAAIPMLFPAVWNTAFTLGGIQIKFMYLVLIGVLFFGLKLKAGK